MPEVRFRLRTPEGAGVADAAILAAYSNGTYRTGRTDSEGDWTLDLYRTDQEMTVLAAAPDHLPLSRTVVPEEGPAEFAMEPSTDGRSSILFTKSTGHIPGIEGRLNPINDGRIYFYADNIAVDDRVANPAPIEIGESLHLIDVYGIETEIRFIVVTAQFSLIEYTEPRPFGAQL